MAPPLLRWLAANARAPLPDNDPSGIDTTRLGPLAARTILLARDSATGLLSKRDGQPDPEAGIIHPGSINNNAIFALFGLIGVGFVVTGIWFFFWAKNGGFYFKKTDWDDYKSTVLRRRGPNGTLLSGATPSTDLGGGSIYKDVLDGGATTTVDDDGRTEVTDSTAALTGITAGASDIAGRERRRRKREQKEREKERRREEKRAAQREKKEGGAKLQKASGGPAGAAGAARKVGPDGALIDEQAEAEAEAQLRSYRHERPARVGGLNKQAEGSSWDGSSNPTNSSAGGGGSSDAATSELLGNRERTPTNTPTKKSAAAGGIRKVYSTADRNAERESERIRAEARKLQEKGRAAAAAAGSSLSSSPRRRDFSWQKAEGSRDDADTHVPGSWTESEVGSDLGTKVYRHSLGRAGGGSGAGSSSIPGTATSDFAYAEEKRRKRNGSGYRRGRDDGYGEGGH